MLINGIDISSLGVKLYDRILNNNSVYTVDDWLDGDIQPTNIRQQVKFRTISLSFLVLGNNEQDAFHRISRLTKELKKATIVFDDMDLSFDVSILGTGNTKRLKNGNFIVSYSLHSDYAKGEREIYTTNANLTNAFKLNVLYYQNSTQLISSESITIRASSFTGVNDTLESIGIEIDKYQPNYYEHGIATNLNGLELNYSNLQYIGTLIINYAPTQYNLSVNYLMDDGTGYFNEILQETVNFTYPQLQNIQTIGQLIKPQRYQPVGYKSNITFTGELTVENILALSPIQVLYQKIENARTKNILVGYYKEDDNGGWEQITTQIVNITETQFYDGITFNDLFNIQGFRPNPTYYNLGYIVDYNKEDLITYDELDLTYSIRYPKLENIIFVEYYAGLYPGWYRIATGTITTKYRESYESNFSLEQLGLDIDRYHTTEYEAGEIFNTGSFDTYDNIINAGVIQIYYRPINYTVVVNFYTDGTAEPNTQSFTVNATDFFGEPILTDLFPVGDYKPEGYQMDPSRSYSGEITLQALTQASPITITFEEIEADRTKNILIHYKQELSSVFSALNTSLITINESDCIGGVRLKDIINLDLYRPSYYEPGVIDSYSSNALLQYDDIQSEYNILYLASSYSTPVRYYTDEVDDANWIGSSSITYRVIDFETNTTLYDLGMNVNGFKPSYCDDGEVQYRGPVNFQALRELESIDIVYETVEEPGDDEGIDYPHRFLFLQHNDLGDYEGLHPEWTLNHAFINTGITAQDMSKLTVIMECKRVDNNIPLHDVNGAYGYLFGSSSGNGSFFMRFNNQTQYHSGSLTGVNTYEAKAGYYTNQLTLTEDTAIGWSETSGIYASARDGYSTATFTYSNPLQTENARMPYPLYLFANNNAGSYQYGLAGIGIYGCRIYYDNILVRDMIPVQFYDKIGDLVAPSNCLYDKITKSFFEDGTGMNSFNIIDDDRYEDTNPDHKIGFCYVNYYQNGVRFKTAVYYFRASDFIDQVYNPYTKWQVEENQPNYYKPGVILDYSSIECSFDGLNNRSFSVNYEEDENQIIVNYYKDDGIGEPELIESEIIQLKESDFYQNPTFGDIVRLNKYKPEGYKTDFVFDEPKVSFARVLRNSPYDIFYTVEDAPLQDYTTTVRYIKKVYGVRTYETIGDITLHFNQTDFRDGEYIDFYIDKNALKPEHYYLDGEYYQWYEMDERLASPDDLKELYTVVYDCETQYLPVNYYTDEVDDANLIASTTWGFRLDDFEPTYPFYLADQLPNTYINKYRPANCGGGILQNSNIEYTFLSLVALDEIAIVYESITEPHDPAEAYYEKKVLYWGDLTNKIYPSNKEILMAEDRIIHPWEVPYIDLGYRPKEIGRLRVEWTGASKANGVASPKNGYSVYSEDYMAIFGYKGAPKYSITEGAEGTQVIHAQSFPVDNVKSGTESSKGYFAISGRVPSTQGANWIYNYNGPSSIDGQLYTNNLNAQNGIVNDVYYIKPGIKADFRRGFRYDIDENYESIDVFRDYAYNKVYNMNEIPEKETDGYMQVMTDNTIRQNDWWIANPFTVVLDAYHNYCSIWNYSDSNYPFSWQITDEDNPVWEDIERPKGSLSLFTATNPTTGKPNFLPEMYWAYPSLGVITGSYSLVFGNSAVGVNPYSPGNSKYGEVEYTVETVVNQPTDGSAPIVQVSTQHRNVLFADWLTPTYPWQAGGVLWSLKVYDQDRLVRDLVPVAKGDVIYDYTMPDNGLFDLITEIFFGNSNPGEMTTVDGQTKTFTPAPLYVIPDILSYGKITTNYYDYDNSFIDNKFIDVPTWFCGANTTIEDILEWNDFKPDDYHLDGWIDVDQDWSWVGGKMNLAQIYEMGTVNIYYRLRTFTKTVVYYQGNVRVGSRDIMYSLDDIDTAQTLDDLGIDVDLYYDPNFKHGRIIYNEDIIANDDIEAFINAPSPIVVYDKLTQQEAPNLLYIEYYRGGAYDDTLIELDENDPNYFNCELTARVLNPNGAIKYYNHYHQALYEDENFGEFIPYQVRVLDKYAGLHYGPARKYKTLAMIITPDIYTIIQERNGWGRLREYPNAWVLLSAVEPITGPGQNPDYDIADSLTATIPFGEYVNITKMTVDRLWCYSAEIESWVKAEDISFNQAGKLYNGLKVEVIDLDELDFTNVSSLNDLGIDIQKYRLRFHDMSDYVYEGSYTYNALSELHEIDIVYPETIYTYNCIYYKDNKNEINRLGASAFSCSISDWNPDWDLFIETSWQTITVPIEGKARRYDIDPTYLLLYTIDENNNLVRQSQRIHNSENIPIIGPTVVLNNKSYYPTDKTEDGDFIYFTPDRYTTIITPFGGYETMTLNPTLYRDTAIVLTWDYFGFDNNLYRPEGYGEGIYLWNPRSWDKDNIKFSFEELVKCGTQYVVYPIFDPDTYKIWIQGNYLGKYKTEYINVGYGQQASSYQVYINNPGLEIDLSDENHSVNLYAGDHYSVYLSGEWHNDLGGYQETDNSLDNAYYINTHMNRMVPLRLANIYLSFYQDTYALSSINLPFDLRLYKDTAPLSTVKNGDMIIGDYSNYRYSPTAIIGLGNQYENREIKYYLVGNELSGNYYDLEEIQDNSNLTGYHHQYEGNTASNLNSQFVRGVVYDAISYYDFMMIHYYVPVPKGLWYKYDGETRRIPDNGMFDLLTGEFKPNFRAVNYTNNSSVIPSGYSGTLTDGKELVFLRNQEISETNAYDLFNGWEYDTTEVELYKITDGATIGYTQPDEYSIQVRELTPGLILPISAQTSDSQHKVVGDWDKSCDQWIKRTEMTTISGYNDITPENATYALVPGTISSFYVYNDPKDENETSIYSYGSAPGIVRVYYACNDRLFDGSHWIPRAYTSSATTPLNKNFVITQNTSYYRFPIADVEYRINSYLYGERITVLYVCENNPNWGYTGQGWIQIDGNTSEVL